MMDEMERSAFAERAYAIGDRAFETALAVARGRLLADEEIAVLDGLRVEIREQTSRAEELGIDDPAIVQALSDAFLDAEFARSGGRTPRSGRLAANLE